MDKTDIMLMQLLLLNSRLPYRKLAEKLDLSVNAVHKRIQVLIDLGIIRTFTARISLSALKGISVLAFGRSTIGSVEEVYDSVGGNDSTFWVTVAGGNYLYIGAYLQDISELDSYVSHVKKEANMSDLTVGLLNYETPLVSRNASFNSLDYQIIYALHKNSRKLFLDVAEELGVSTKTVRRRLSRMIREGLIELSLEWYPDKSNDIMSIFHLNLSASADKSKVYSLLFTKYSPNSLFSWSFSNLPNLMLFATWTNTMMQLQDIRKNLQSEEVFESAVPYILQTGRLFDTWRDKRLLKLATPHPLTNQ